MTDVIDRVGPAASPPDDLAPVALTDLEPAPPSARTPFALALPGRVLVAILSMAAAVIHFVMVPSHMPSSALDGYAFVAAGWFQLVVAAVVLAKPTRALLRLAVVGNLAFIGVWAASRTVGLPIGGHAGVVEAATFVDLACVGIEAALVLLCVALLARPRLAANWDGGTLVAASIVPLGILALTTAAVASPSAVNHGHDHSDTVVAGAGGGDDHSHPATPAAAPNAAATANHEHTHAIGSGNVEGEAAEVQPDKPLDAATQKALGDQLVAARVAALKYPTVRDAKAAGMIVAGGMAPGVGAHYQMMSANALRGINPDGTVNPDYPGSYIYNGTNDDATIVGVMYTSMTDQMPEGFAGPNDHWHRHNNLCLKFANGQIEVPVPTDQDVTKAQCDALGGRFMQKSVWMVHAWVVPGWESPAGVFSHDNPNLHCPDGTDDVVGVGLCKVQ